MCQQNATRLLLATATSLRSGACFERYGLAHWNAVTTNLDTGRRIGLLSLTIQLSWIHIIYDPIDHSTTGATDDRCECAPAAVGCDRTCCVVDTESPSSGGCAYCGSASVVVLVQR
jgi:hypothetical protein